MSEVDAICATSLPGPRALSPMSTSPSCQLIELSTYVRCQLSTGACARFSSGTRAAPRPGRFEPFDSPARRGRSSRQPFGGRKGGVGAVGRGSKPGGEVGALYWGGAEGEGGGGPDGNPKTKKPKKTRLETRHHNPKTRN